MNIYNDTLFTGPIFIIGMPRSGTKLLRDLLNEHSRIGIPNIETNFLPTWVNNWQKYGDLSKRSVFKKFYRKMVHLSYFKYMKEGGYLIDDDIWYNHCRNFTPSGVFEALIRHDAQIEYDSMKIWGDKTPSYIKHIHFIKKVFPSARFIHIIRDVRDYCLSINRAWGKNMIRAAQRWCDDVQEAKIKGRELYKDYIEIRYEDLISEPDLILKKICDFLDIEFDSQIKHLSRPTENLGDAKGLKEIKKDNKEKYLYLMNKNLLNEIETISASVLKSCGYSVNYNGEIKRINRVLTLYYKLLDGVNLLKFGIRERGFFKGIKWNLIGYFLSKISTR